MKEVVLRGNHMVKRFEEAMAPILNQVDIELYDGDFTIIMGASGSGKSTLLYSLSAMSHINDGEIIYKDENIASYSENQMARLRSDEFGFVFQQIHLLSHCTLLENVEVAGYLNKNRSSEETERRAKQLLNQMNVGDAIQRLPSKVSGGEAQRAAIARAIINEPKILFADEPTGALNKKNSDEVLHLLQNLHEQGQNILMVTHDIHAAAFGNRLLFLEDGQILAELDLTEVPLEDMKEREIKVHDWLTALMW